MEDGPKIPTPGARARTAATCACRSVSYRTERGIPAHPGTMTAWWWECDSCGRRFLPESEVEAERVRGVLWRGAARGWRDRAESAESGREEVGRRPDWLERVAQDVEEKTRDRPSWRRSRSVNEDLARLEAGIPVMPDPLTPAEIEKLRKLTDADEAARAEREACAALRDQLLDEVDEQRLHAEGVADAAYLRGKVVGLMQYYHAIRSRDSGHGEDHVRHGLTTVSDGDPCKPPQ